MPLLTILFLCSACLADEIKLPSPIESVGLFKNGVAVVRRSAEISGPGTYVLEDVPEPIHGTFWVEGDVPVDVQTTMRDVEVPVRAPGNFQEELVGQKVVLHLKEPNSQPISGTVMELARPKGMRPGFALTTSRNMGAGIPVTIHLLNSSSFKPATAAAMLT